ncbi:MAG TPA: beta-propeller fold lactonase family protein [Blastocatellia bacterium]|nr:beta-propeller fold lactonase family protein [Blastocatellia bacterium]
MTRTKKRLVNRLSFAFILVFGVLAGPLTQTIFGRQAPRQDYLIYVVCESADKIALIRFGQQGARVEKLIETGSMPSDIDGPHGIVVSPDKQFYYVSLGHGRPYGSVWKYSTKDNSVLGKVTLGFFPATMDISSDGGLLYVVNFNLHGDMVPSSVSIVATEQMIEVARVPTCTMPHGSRINRQGTKQYSACMMDDLLVEIDTNSLKVSRHFVVTKGKERGMDGSPASHAVNATAAHDSGGHGMEPPKPGDTSCSPTWAQPSADGKFVFVACNKSDEIVEIDAANWKVTRRIPARPGVYNLAVTKDGKLIATNKRDQSVSVYEVKSGREIARVPTKRRVIHGAVVSPDNRYAFISVEGVGAEPGTVEVIDLVSLKRVATVDLPEQAAGIDFFKMEPAR